MAILGFADLSASYPQLYPTYVPQMQRKAPTARLLPWERVTTGQNIGWDATFDGQDAGAVNPDGGALRTAAADPQTAATLGYGAYSAPVKVTTKAQWTGAAQNASAFLENLVGRGVLEGMNRLVKVLNQAIYNGTGNANNQLDSLSLAVAGSGTYANINSATTAYANWKSYSSGNSGSLRSLTLAMIKTATSTIATNSPFGRPTHATTTPALFNSLENLFDAYTHAYYNPDGGSLLAAMGLSKNDKISMNPASVKTAGGQIQRTGFRVMVWENQGLTVVEDPDCTNTAVTNTANIIYFLTEGAVEMQWVPPADVSNYMPDQKAMAAAEQDLGPIAQLLVDFRARGRTQLADEFDLLTLLNLVVKSRAATGLLFDVQ
jgi:hypothetical protein